MAEAQRACPYPIFDSHLHIIDPRYPLVPNQGYLPPPFSTRDYRERTAHLALCGGAVVAGSFQGFDQHYLVAALACLGSRYVGVTNLPTSATDADILALDQAGIRAVRVNLYRGGAEQLNQLDALARRVYELANWHVELYVDARQLADLTPMLAKLPALSIDHLGLSKAGFSALLRLVEHGARVKATGFGRLDFAIGAALKDIVRANPAALMFGTDLPSTRARRPFLDSDISVLIEALDEAQAMAALSANATQFYLKKNG